MSTGNGECGCGCGGSQAREASGGTAAAAVVEEQQAQIRPGLIDRKVTLLMSAGAAVAGNCEPCLRKIVPQLRQAGASDKEIRNAIHTGQMVKDRPTVIMKQVADEIAGTQIFGASESESCPADEMPKDDEYKVTMLIATSAAMAANCEFCLNKVIPDLIEAGVSMTELRRAVEIGQFIKDKPAAIMKEAADVLTGSKLSDEPSSEGCSSTETEQGGGCCG
jgi:alkylhydroperoxidase/carboxymuconolactone decarboxylase family protein YurZ